MSSIEGLELNNTIESENQEKYNVHCIIKKNTDSWMIIKDFNLDISLHVCFSISLQWQYTRQWRS